MKAALTDLVDRCQGDERPDCPILRDLAEVRNEASETPKEKSNYKDT